MKRYDITLYPNVNDYRTIVEADSVEEAIEIAQDEASYNCYFMATKNDVTEIVED
jgi:Mg/Co/Ni transporter MgtE